MSTLLFESWQYPGGIWKAPGFLIVAAPIRALGIGASAVAPSALGMALSPPLDWKIPEELVFLAPRKARFPLIPFTLDNPWATYPLWREQPTARVSFAGCTGLRATLVGGADPQSVRMTRVTPEIRPLVGVKPMRGLPPEGPEEGVMVTSHRLGASTLQKDAQVLEKSFREDGRSRILVGVSIPRGDGDGRSGACAAKARGHGAVLEKQPLECGGSNPARVEGGRPTDRLPHPQSPVPGRGTGAAVPHRCAPAAPAAVFRRQGPGTAGPPSGLGVGVPPGAGLGEPFHLGVGAQHLAAASTGHPPGRGGPAFSALDPPGLRFRRDSNPALALCGGFIGGSGRRHPAASGASGCPGVHSPRHDSFCPNLGALHPSEERKHSQSLWW